MRVKLQGGPFDGQEAEIDGATNRIPSDGGTYVFRGSSLQMTSPDGLLVAGAHVPIFEFEAESS